MSAKPLSHKLISIGIGMTILGIILRLLDVQLLKATKSFNIMEDEILLSVALAIIGSLTTMVGGLMWARVGRLVHLLYWGIAIPLVAVSIAELLDVNIMKSTDILIPVFYVSLLASALILLIAGGRYAFSQRRHQSHL